MAGCAHVQPIEPADVDLVSDAISPSASAFAPGVVAWAESVETIELQIVLQEGRRRRVVDFQMPFKLGGGLGIGWRGHPTFEEDKQLCVAVPEIHCGPAPDWSIRYDNFQVGSIDGAPAVWTDSGSAIEAIVRFEDGAWQPVALPPVDFGYSRMLSSGDGLLHAGRDGASVWARVEGGWEATPLGHKPLGLSALSTSHLFWYDAAPPRIPKVLLGPVPPPGAGTLHRVPLDGSPPTATPSFVGHVSFIEAHGRDGVLIVGDYQAEYWLGGQLVWRLPSRGMSAAIWNDQPWVSIGPTRMRLDGVSIAVDDPSPGRFAWAERIEPSLVDCGDGIGLAWTGPDATWRAWVSGGRVHIGHACPDRVGRWPRGEVGVCEEGTRLERGDHAACVVVGYVHKVTDRTVVQLGRR